MPDEVSIHAATRLRRGAERLAEVPFAPESTVDDVTRRRAGLAIVALVGLSYLLMLGGALTYPVLYHTDEKVHLAYVDAVLDGDLPTVDTRVPQDGGRFPTVAHAYDARYPFGVAGAEANGDIWVANHPPLYYLLSAPGAAITQSIGWDHGPPLTMRVVAATGFAVGLLALAASVDALFPKRPRVTVVATVLAALCPVVIGAGSFGLNDGVAFGAGSVLLAATLRTARFGPTTPRLVALISAGAAASLSRSALLPLVVLAALTWLLATMRAEPKRALGGVALVLGIPAAVSGWFYLRSISLYGDPTGSSHLLTKFDREPSGSAISMLFNGELWAGYWQGLWGTNGLDGSLGSGSLSLGSPDHDFGSAIVPGALLALVVLAGLVRAAVGARRGWSRPDGPTLLAWTVVVLTAGVCVLGVASFVSGGGTPHPRYLLPALPLIVAVAGYGIVRVAEPFDAMRATLYAAVALELVVFSRAGRAIAGAVQVPDLIQQDVPAVATWLLLVGGIALLVVVDRQLRLLSARLAPAPSQAAAGARRHRSMPHPARRHSRDAA